MVPHPLARPRSPRRYSVSRSPPPAPPCRRPVRPGDHEREGMENATAATPLPSGNHAAHEDLERGRRHAERDAGAVRIVDVHRPAAERHRVLECALGQNLLGGQSVLPADAARLGHTHAGRNRRHNGVLESGHAALQEAHDACLLTGRFPHNLTKHSLFLSVYCQINPHCCPTATVRSHTIGYRTAIVHGQPRRGTVRPGALILPRQCSALNCTEGAGMHRVSSFHWFCIPSVLHRQTAEELSPRGSSAFSIGQRVAASVRWDRRGMAACLRGLGVLHNRRNAVEIPISFSIRCYAKRPLLPWAPPLSQTADRA
jgi:hypothetical protein